MKKKQDDELLQAAASVGKLAMARIETRGKGSGVSIPVKITGYRKVYGRLELFCEPIGGQGAVWLNAGHVSMTDDIRKERSSWIHHSNT